MAPVLYWFHLKIPPLGDLEVTQLKQSRRIQKDPAPLARADEYPSGRHTRIRANRSQHLALQQQRCGDALLSIYYKCRHRSGCELPLLRHWVEAGRCGVEAEVGGPKKRLAPTPAGSIAFMVNFPFFWKLTLDMLAIGGYRFRSEIISPGVELRDHEQVRETVEVALLPKVMGGGASSVDANGVEDGTCCRGVEHPTLVAFLEDLEK